MQMFVIRVDVKMKFVNAALLALAASAGSTVAFAQLVRYHSSFESFDRSIRQAFQPNSVGSTGAFGVARFAPVTFDFELEAKKSIEDLADDELKGRRFLSVAM
jgi:hypothetical protein